MDRATARRFLTTARVATLATIRPTGAPHAVPIVFALERARDDSDLLYSAVDTKPKSTRRLARLENIATEPRVAILAHGYEEDWAQLWWVRADGLARTVTGGAELTAGIDRLAEKYPQYRHNRPPGPLVVVALERLTGWHS